MKKTALILMLFAILMKIIGFSREILISYYYGASYISDAYLIALTIPGTVYTIIGTGLITGFIPMYSRIEKEEGGGEADLFTSHFINFMMLCCVILVAVIYLFTKPIIKLFAIGFEGEVLELTVRFTRITCLSIFFTGIVSVYSGYLQIKKRFLIPALMSLPFNICIIGSILLGNRYNDQFLAYGSVAAELVQFLFLLPIVYQCGFRHSPSMTLKDKSLRQTLRLSLPIIIGVSINQINILVDKTIASQLAEGGISALNYAGKLGGTIQAIFISSVIAVLFPIISQMAAQDKLQEFKSYIQKAMIGIVLFLIPVSIGFMIFAKPIIILLYGRGAFDATAIEMTSVSLFFYSIGMLGVGLREILSRAFYSLQNTRIPMINAIIGILINVGLNLILSSFMGIAGLALATSIAACITTILLYIGICRKIGALVGRKGFLIAWKLLSASLLMGLLAWLSYTLFSPSIGQSRSLLVSIFVGGFSYIVLVYYMKLPYIEELFSNMKEVLHRLVGEGAYPIKLLRGQRTERRKRLVEEEPSIELIMGTGDLQKVAYRRAIPFIGIVIVTYNNSEGLRQMLEQIRRQSFQRYRVYIIDNGSTVKNEEYIGDLLKQYRYYSYYRLNKNMGRAGGFYYGLKLAYEHGASAIWAMEEDSLPHRYALEALVNASRGLKGRYCLLSNTTDRFEIDRITVIQNSQPRINSVTELQFSGLLIPRGMIDEVGLPKRELYKGFDDWDYSRRALQKGYRIYRVRDSLVLSPVRGKEFRQLRLLKKTYDIPIRSKIDWFYYLRNDIVLHSEGIDNKKLLRRYMLQLVGVLIAYPDCFPAAVAGIRDGRRGRLGRSERYHD